MYRKPLMFGFFCFLTSGFLAVAQETSSTLSANNDRSSVSPSAPSQNFSSSATLPSASVFSSSSSSASSSFPKAATNASVADALTTAVPSSSSSSPSQETSTASPSSTSPSLTSSSAPSSSSSTAAAAPSLSPTTSSSPSSSVSTTISSTTTISSISQAQTTAASTSKPRVLTDTTYIPMVAAIVSGFCLLVVLILFLTIMAIVYRHLGKEDPTTVNMLKKQKKTADVFYSGQEPQSAQQLVTSTSITSFGSSSSDPRLDNHVTTSPGVHYNRGFDVDYHPSGTGNGPNGNEDGFRPIQIVAADVNPRSSSSRV